MDPLDTQNRTSWHNHSSLKRRQSVRESLQPWTPSRCHRLLRPLKTHISALRREIDLEDSERLSDDVAQDGTAETNRSSLQHTYSRRGRKPQARTSTSAGPARTPKRKPKRTITQPGEIVLPTPIIRRARGQQLSSPIQQPPLADKGGGIAGKKRFADFRGQRTPSVLTALESELQSLRNRVSATKLSLYDSILRTVHSLLTATAVFSPSSPANRSLVAMCLRMVPEYIGELEYWEQHDAEEQGTKSTLQNSEISNEIYGELEAMLPISPQAGHLRIVVRAHAIKVVRDSIAEGLLDDSFSILLIKLCCRTKSFREGEELLQELIDRSYPKPRSADSTFDESRKLAPLKTLRDFARDSARPQFMQRQLSRLLAQQKLPLLWLSTKEFSTIWSCMVKALSRDDICDDTASFTVQMIITLSTQAKLDNMSLIRTHSNDLKSLSQQTLISVITAISTLPILGQEARDSSGYQISQTNRSSASQKVGYIIQRCIYELRRTRKPGWPATVLNLAAFFTNTLPDSHKGSIVSRALARTISGQEIMEGRQHYEALTSLIGAIAQCCGRGSTQPSHYYLGRLCDQLEHELSPELSPDGIPRTLRMDCAFVLAERTNDLRDLAFAESLDASTTKQQVIPTPRRKSVSSAYRWDEDICEWITVTPAPIQRQRRSLPSSLSPPPEQKHGSGGGQEAVSAKHLQPKQRQKLARGVTATQQPGPADKTSRRLRSGTPLGKRNWEAHQSVDLLDDDNDDVVEGRGTQRDSNIENGVFSLQTGAKKRRTTALKPSRAILKTITNISRDGECSEDELGL